MPRRWRQARRTCYPARAFSIRSKARSPIARSQWGSARAADGRVALVFGNETSGLSNEEIARCQRFLVIPSNPAYGSLNVASAVQVACYELSTAARAFAAPASRERGAASVGDVEGLFAHLESAAVSSGFLDPKKPGRFMERMRRMFARVRLERQEVKLLRGLLGALEKRKRR